MDIYREYDDETLHKIQQLELDIMRDFNYLCDKYNIDYFGGGGTGIGAVRHGGFIPWDDDIDLGLVRKDYEKFIEVAQKEFSHKYNIINAEIDPRYPFMSTRWMLKDTEFREEALKDYPGELGIFLDLFCYDNVADDEKAMKRQVVSAWFWGKLLILRYIKSPVLGFHGFKKMLVLFCCGIAHYGMKLFHVSPKFLYRQAMKHSKKYNNVETKRVGHFFDPTPFTSIMEVGQVFPTRVMDFSGVPMRFPCKLEEYLDRRFGDYMKLPKEEDRHNHPPYRLDFGKYQ